MAKREDLSKYDYDAVLAEIQAYVDLAIELAEDDENRVNQLYQLLVTNRKKVGQVVINFSS